MHKTAINIVINLITIFLVHSVYPESWNFNVQTNKIYNINIDSVVDDINLTDPIGVKPGEINDYFIRNVKIKNTGTSIIKNFIFIVNGRNLEHFGFLRQYLRLNNNNLKNTKKIYMFFKDNMFHADSGNLLAMNPFSAFSYFGYTLCYHNTASMMNVLYESGINGRVVGRNSHTFAEFNVDNNWIILDGDQKMVYPKLDNIQLAGIDDILADPFISLRVKKNGKYASYNLINSWINTARFNLVSPNYEKTSTIIMKESVYKHNNRPPTNLTWSLFPGEEIIFHRDKTPEIPYNFTELSRWKNAKEFGLGLIELTMDMDKRNSGLDKPNDISVRYPIVKIVEHNTGKSIHFDEMNPFVFNYNGGGRISVFMQCSKVSMPLFKKKGNSLVLLSADSNNTAAIKIQHQPFSGPSTLPECTILNQKSNFDYTPPKFLLDSNTKNPDKIWWQISDSKKFKFIIPNFEQVQAFSPSIQLDTISQTFFNSNSSYYFRAKLKADNVWGEWSKPIQFIILKPKRIEQVQTRYLPDEKIEFKFEYPNDPDVDFLIFGSNRLDFIPDIYTQTQLMEQKNGKVITIKNKNLLRKSKKTEIIIDHDFVFYRIIPLKKNIHGNPSELLITYDTAKSYPPYLNKPKVLQLKASIIKDDKYPNGYKDVQAARVRNVEKLLKRID